MPPSLRLSPEEGRGEGVKGREEGREEGRGWESWEGASLQALVAGEGMEVARDGGVWVVALQCLEDHVHIRVHLSRW